MHRFKVTFNPGGEAGSLCATADCLFKMAVTFVTIGGGLGFVRAPSPRVL